MSRLSFTTTLKKLQKYHACKQGYDLIANHVGVDFNGDIPLETILDNNGLRDCIWALRATDGGKEVAQEFTIRVAMKGYFGSSWVKWANNWLNGTDRSRDTAYAAAAAAYAAAAAAYDAATAAACDAAYATCDAAYAAADAAYADYAAAYDAAYAADVAADAADAADAAYAAAYTAYDAYAVVRSKIILENTDILRKILIGQ